MSKKEKYIHYQAIPIPIYVGVFVIVLSNSHKKVKKLIPQFKNKWVFGHSYYGNHQGKRAFFMILNFDRKSDKITHGAITHESTHISHMIAQIVGITPDFENDEPIAYLSGWITDRVYEFAKTQNKTIE